jgi:hypothetical protein
MSAEVSWSHAEITNTESETEELWHVAIDSDDVKVLTLDQLDDLFRLEIVDENVKIWQPGMSEWKTLGEVAGIESEAPESAEPTQVKLQTAELPSGVQTVAASAWAPRVVVPPPAPPPRVEAVAVAIPAPARSGSFISASLIEEDDLVLPPKSPETLRPVAADDVNPFAPKPSRSGTWLTLLAAAAGIVLTLYRNDVLKSVATSAGQARVYSSVESALGGPGFGTVGSIEVIEKASLPETSVASNSVTKAAEAPATEEKEDKLKDLEVLAVDSMATIRDPRKEKATRPAPRAQQNAASGFQTQKAKKSINSGKAAKYDPLNGTL